MIELRPVRFTDNLEPMREFLEALGLRPRIESIRGGWVDLVAGSGMVALHDAATSATGGRPGETRLSFEADDVDALAEQLKAGGYDDATVWDEAYGRVLSVSAPDGASIWVDERSEDLYGYQLHRAQPDPRITVAPILYVDDPEPWRSFLAAIAGDASDPITIRQNSGTQLRLGFWVVEAESRELTDPDGQPVMISSPLDAGDSGP